MANYPMTNLSHNVDETPPNGNDDSKRADKRPNSLRGST
ncbi:hypothetical protein MSTE_03857 [Mycobacteroides stephanolepidis]|uniref:Uncharacterized protein n=1 Tax=[Mycobacterium] stephanolepidis TaxID=1520670 RepID=A0A1Z4F1M4_9MYCO|nr:hypothetical protein MSTE_03857 [[Mycobacterium] stephanolepidis]